MVDSQDTQISKLPASCPPGKQKDSPEERNNLMWDFGRMTVGVHKTSPLTIGMLFGRRVTCYILVTSGRLATRNIYVYRRNTFSAT